MHDPKLIEAMARANREAWRDQCENRHETVEWDDVDEDEREMCVAEATAALTALCAARPDVAALLRGEAVAVPRNATWEMCEAARDAGSDEESWGGIYDAFISRSPWAQEEKRDAG